MPGCSQPARDGHLRKPPAARPKLCGADIEFGNWIDGLNRRRGTTFGASGALLTEIEGLPKRNGALSVCNCASGTWGTWGAWNGDVACRCDTRDMHRRYLANGGCFYIDLNHLEACIPECLSAWDHVGCWHAALCVVKEALRRANEKLPVGQKIRVLANNSDGMGNSYGSHLNFLVSRQCFDDIFERRLHYMIFLASHFVSSIVYTGAGKAGSENRRPAVDYQIAQRADFFETLTGPQTTHNRPIVNSRDEPLCGGDRHSARLHVIFYDNTLCHVASLLKVGVTQIILAMIEQNYTAPGLILDDPLGALIRFSHDPGLRRRARLLSGAKYTAVELQLALHGKARRFVEAGRADGLVPRAAEILAIWEDTLLKLREGDLDALAGRVDWVLKLSALERARTNRGLDWGSPEIKHLDHLYSSLDPAEGLFWAYEAGGLVERVVPRARIERFVHEPPDDTRAWLRAELLRRLSSDVIWDVNWDAVTLRLPRKRSGGWISHAYRKLRMPDPTGHTRVQCEPVFRRSSSLLRALMALGLEEAYPNDASSSEYDSGSTAGRTRRPAPASPGTAGLANCDQSDCRHFERSGQ